MKKWGISLLVLAILLPAVFLIGFSLGRRTAEAPVTVFYPEQAEAAPVPASSVHPREPVPVSPETEPDLMVNINTAAAEELAALDGIGETLAGRIVDYRKEHGSFSSPEEIMQVPGIGQKKYAQIAPHITVGGST